MRSVEEEKAINFTRLEDFNHFLVDRDGSLIGSCKTTYDSYRRSLELFGYTVDQSFFDDIHSSVSWPQLVANHFLKMNADVQQLVRESKSEFFSADLKAISWNTDLIDFLSGKNWYLVSNGSNESSLKILESFSGVSRPQEIVGPNQDLRPKPAADMYRFILNRYRIPTNQAIAIEDSKIGLQSASLSGLNTFQIPHFCP